MFSKISNGCRCAIRPLISTPSHLQLIFDSQCYWRANSRQVSPETVGLFGYTDLKTPKDFGRIVSLRMQEADKLVNLVCNAADKSEMAKTVKRLDRLSDIICSVVDTAELIRHVHPVQEIVEAANDAHVSLSNYLNRLNTHTGLYAALVNAYNTPDIRREMTSQEERVAQLLIMDFENSGIHMPTEIRRQFVDLNDRVLKHGQDFVMNSAPAVSYIQIKDPYTALKGVPKRVIDSLSNRRRVAIIPIGHNISYYILRTCSNEEVRKEIYIAMNTSSEKNIRVLEAMLQTRGEIASLLGKNSYADLHLSDKMAKNPETVMNFLSNLAKIHKPNAVKDFERLQDLKRTHTGDRETTLQPWDRYFYAQFVSSKETDSSGADPFHSYPQHDLNDDLARYFSVGRTFEGLSRLFTALYGISLVPSTLKNGEAWHSDVRKLDVIDENFGKIGVVYCDLFNRDESDGRKCSRRVDQDEVLSRTGTDHNLEMEREGGAKRYQMPIVVLVTSFSKSDDKPPLLSLSEVETLFHEFGHAMHSMLARTDFQHISGTRCAMDFVEVPSIMTEFFAKSPLVLCSFASDYKTGQPLDPKLLLKHQKESDSLESLETQHQIQLAILDQLYHSPQMCREFLDSSDSSSDSTEILKKVIEKVGVFPFIHGTSPQTQFSHLLTYGSSYYSYFWSRKWASRIWNDLFMKGSEEVKGDQTQLIELLGDSHWRKSGELVKTELLAVGGGRDAWVGLKKLGVLEQ